MPWLATHLSEALPVSESYWEVCRGRDIRSAAAIWKSWFSSQIETKRSKVLPLMELVGLRVKAVALAASTADAAVDVYCFCAWLDATSASDARVEKSFILLLELYEWKRKAAFVRRS